MAFCCNCGNELVKGAKFCFECGAPIGDTDKSVRKTVYSGELHKCPSCGENLDAFVSTCPSCGYELRGTSTADSIIEFSAKIDNAQTDEQRANIIRNFPIPNSKEDILEFMVLASTNIQGEQERMVFDAWLVKFEQSYQKAQLVITDNSVKNNIEALYIRTQKQIKKEKKVQDAKTDGKTGNMAGKVLFSIGRSMVAIVGIVLFIVALFIDKKGGNSIAEQVIGMVLAIVSAATLTKRGASFLEILIGACSGGVSLFISTKLSNGSMLRICGVVVLIIVAVSFIKKISIAKKDN